MKELNLYVSVPKTETRIELNDWVGVAEVNKWCGKCNSNKEVESSSAYCPSCGTSFGTVVKKDDSIQKQADKNLEATKSSGGEYEYSKTTITTSDGTTTTTEATKYKKP